MKPERIQLSRKKGWKMPANTVKVDRSNRFFGNPFPVINLFSGKGADYWHVFQSGIEPEMAVDLFKTWLKYRPRIVERIKNELRGKNLACWCNLCEKHKGGKPIGEPCNDCAPCHADVLLKIANE